MTFHKRGGLLFWRIGRIGGSVYIARPVARTWATAQCRAENIGLISVALVTLATFIGG